MNSNPGQVEFGVRSTSILSHTWTKNIISYKMIELEIKS